MHTVRYAPAPAPAEEEGREGAGDTADELNEGTNDECTAKAITSEMTEVACIVQQLSAG